MRKKEIKTIIVIIFIIFAVVAIINFTISGDESANSDTELAGQIVNYKEQDDDIRISLGKEYASISKDGTFLLSGPLSEGLYSYSIWGNKGLYTTDSENTIAIYKSQRNSLMITIKKVNKPE